MTTMRTIGIRTSILAVLALLLLSPAALGQQRGEDVIQI